MSCNFQNIITAIREVRSPSFLYKGSKSQALFSDKILCPDLFVTGDRFLVRGLLARKKKEKTVKHY